MDASHARLWQQINELRIDPLGAALTFTARLARENGWSLPVAHRVFDEYKRFVFLTMVAEHEVTPSHEVDEAWHLHLTYTRSYWNGLCQGILGRPLHHVPTKGGPAERDRHIQQYEQTLATYAKWFGEPPPEDIWPPPEIRFAKDSHYVRLERRRFWIVPKPRFPRRIERRVPFVAAALAAPVVVGFANPLDLTGPAFLLFYAFVCGLASTVAIALRHYLRRNEPSSDEAPLAPYEVACLGGGVPGALRACLASLVIDKRVLLTADAKASKTTCNFKAMQPETAGGQEIERAMLRAASRKNGATSAELLNAARPAAEEIQSALQSRGLMESDESFAAARWGPIVLLALVWILGFVKLLVGISRDKPVVFLAIGLFALAALMSWLWRRPLRTLRGESHLEILKNQNHELRWLNLSLQPATGIAPFASGDLLLAAGLFGLTALDHPDVRVLEKSLKPISTTTAGSGCGASTGCGGGGCGGGGCGGCGGGD
jgi:uncharacterized protein (TIGR04222 family)